MKATSITAMEAWRALGADLRYKPKSDKAPASGTALWLLNDLGRLRIDWSVVPSPEWQPIEFESGEASRD
jgi:hypothetical protein